MLEAHLADRLAQAGVGTPDGRAREVWLLLEAAIALMFVHGDRADAARPALPMGCLMNSARHERGPAQALSTAAAKRKIVKLYDATGGPASRAQAVSHRPLGVGNPPRGGYAGPQIDMPRVSNLWP